ncbi:heterokaryon incompatibility protein [Rutstroemia sp. NJR-2017a BVV2]|nr:heterokaryon incompatibility protein [Rutstroemia sp. NJR-2017a BVV2]
MTGVYSCSAINIAATSAKDGTMGCFFKGAWAFRMPHPMHQNRLHYGYPFVGSRAPEELTSWDFSLRDPFDTLLSEPLLRRAWVFQERFLAPRTVHFTSSQIFWECKEGHWCGMFPKEVQFTGELGYIDGFSKSIHQRRDSNMWQYIVEIYSTGMLTYGTDRLVAISGVAGWLQDQNKDEYLAGIWRKDMEKQLCWQAVRPVVGHSIISRPKVYLGPSWSWASILCGVKFMETKSTRWRTRTPLIRVLSAHTILENEDYKFGKVTGGVVRLVVRYLLCGAEYPPSPEDEGGDISNSSGDTILDSFGIVWDCPEDPSPRKKLYLLPVNSTCDDSANMTNDSVDNPGISRWRSIVQREKEPAHYTVDGIILEATDTSKRAEYRRVRSWTSGDEHIWEKGNDSGELLYEEVAESGTKLHVITII